MRRQSLARALRGLIAGPLTTLLALLFHVIGGGAVPDAPALAACVGAVTWAAILIGRRRPSLPLLVTSVGLSQVVLHIAFSVTTGTAVLGGPGTHAGHADHGGALVLVDAHAGQAMWVSHLLAGVLTVIVIRRGEAVLRMLPEIGRLAARRFARYVVVLLAPRPVVASGVPAVAAARPLGETADAFGSVLVRRGPPVRAI